MLYRLLAGGGGAIEGASGGAIRCIVGGAVASFLGLFLVLVVGLNFLSAGVDNNVEGRGRHRSSLVGRRHRRCCWWGRWPYQGLWISL